MGQICPGPTSRARREIGREQVGFLFRAYIQGNMKQPTIQESHGIGMSRLLALLKEDLQRPENFSVSYERSTPRRMSEAEEAEIEKELLRGDEAGRGSSATHLRLQLFGHPGPSREEGDPCLGNNDHGGLQSPGLLSAPNEEESSQSRRPDHFHQGPRLA